MFGGFYLVHVEDIRTCRTHTDLYLVFQNARRLGMNFLVEVLGLFFQICDAYAVRLVPDTNPPCWIHVDSDLYYVLRNLLSI